jgi:hypothetical protein
MITILVRVGSVQPTSSKQYYNLSMYMPKRVRDKGQPCLSPILQLISSYHPSVFLKLSMKFSYNLTTTSLSSEGVFLSSNLIQRLVLGTVSFVFLKSMKQQRRLGLLLQRSSIMIIIVTRWYAIE